MQGRPGRETTQQQKAHWRYKQLHGKRHLDETGRDCRMNVRQKRRRSEYATDKSNPTETNRTHGHTYRSGCKEVPRSARTCERTQDLTLVALECQVQGLVDFVRALDTHLVKSTHCKGRRSTWRAIGQHTGREQAGDGGGPRVEREARVGHG